MRHHIVVDRSASDGGDQSLARADGPRTGGHERGDNGAHGILERIRCNDFVHEAEPTRLGGIESLIGCPFVMSHGAFPAELKRRKGISEATVRLSVGIENPDDLCNDLAQALERAASAG